jgi:hypothetical protein
MGKGTQVLTSMTRKGNNLSILFPFPISLEASLQKMRLRKKDYPYEFVSRTSLNCRKKKRLLPQDAAVSGYAA